MRNQACIFIDGENLRFSIDRLFKEYHQSHYLPFADWGSMFDAIEKLASRKMNQKLNLIRSYWYVISDVEYDRRFKGKDFKESSLENKRAYLEKYAPSIMKRLDTTLKGAQLKKKIEKAISLLKENSNKIDRELSSWNQVQATILQKTNKFQFQKFGYLKVFLDNGKGKLKKVEEKGVDVKLATDLMGLKDIYDVAIIVSGDGDYIPAITAIKSFGKQVLVVDFKDQNGLYLPGVSKKLKQHSDFNFSLNYNTMYDICRYDMDKKDPPRILDLESGYDF